MQRTSLGMIRASGPALTTFALMFLLSGCADPFVEALCDGNLKTVVRGALRGQEVDHEFVSVKGGVDIARFWLSFPSPAAEPGEVSEEWLLDFGINPLGGIETAGTGIQNDMRAWNEQGGTVGHPFSVTSKSQGEQCDVLRGELCGGFGVDPDGSGVLERDLTVKERYHRAKSGQVKFQEMRPEKWVASFSVELGADEDEPTMLGGHLEGCFRAYLDPQGNGATFR